jgi:hypothetical protein
MTHMSMPPERSDPSPIDPGERSAPSPRPTTHVFILFHLVAIGLWLLPPCALRNELVSYVEPYMQWSALFQNWAMFSPNPQSDNFHLEAEVIFADGTTATWRYPRMSELGTLARYQKERYRKFSEWVRQDARRALWPDLARFVARRYANPANPPRTVALARHWAMIPLPRPGSAQPLPAGPAEAKQFICFTYEVRSEDLP